MSAPKSGRHSTGRYAMPDRLEVERLLRELYAARLGGDLEALCRTFAQDSRLDIAGTSYSSPMAIRAAGLGEIRSWLALLVKTFQLSDQRSEERRVGKGWGSRARR